MKATPHIEVKEENVIAKTVLMPGDPLRAKYIAETYLTDVVCFNKVRGMLGFTGYYKGVKVSVMGSGMGMPSIGIYSYELFSNYGVENIIRIGSAGAYTDKLNLFDVVLAKDAYSESSFAYAQAGIQKEVMESNSELNEVIKKAANSLGIKINFDRIHSSDVFYHQEPVHEKLYNEKGCTCVEMESYALFHNAQVLNKRAACLLTISDSLVTHAETTSEQRQTAFNQMMEIALTTATLL
ncbi:MAG: purine-nucleoside phosphorylase [Bacilli bacterium]|nr:purine-nucleoside phosphorylase [Bacilli bacterium]